MEKNPVYDQFAEAYARHSELSPANAYYDRPAILSMVGDVAGKRVLELGSAAGVLAEQLVERGADVVGLDRQPEMIELARKRVGQRARFEVADITAPLDEAAPGEFDLVVASLVLHYIEDWTPLLLDLHRRLVHDGALVFSVHHPAADWQWFDYPDYLSTELVGETWDLEGRDVQVSFYRRPLSAMFNQLTEAGFRVRELNEPRPLPELARLAPDAFAELNTKPIFLFVRASAD